MIHILTLTKTKRDGVTIRSRVLFNKDTDHYTVDFSTRNPGSRVFHPHRAAAYITDDEQDATSTAKWWIGDK